MAFYWYRIAGLALALAIAGFVLWCALEGWWQATGMSIIAIGILLAALTYDLMMSRGQQHNFLEDAEARGMTEYAEKLRREKW